MHKLKSVNAFSDQSSSLVIYETEEDFKIEHREWFTRQVDRNIRCRRSRATRIEPKPHKNRLAVSQSFIVESPKIVSLQDLSQIKSLTANSLHKGFNRKLVFLSDASSLYDL